MTSTVSTRSTNHSLMHPFDVESGQNESLDLFAEELPEQVQLVANIWSDCLSSASSFSCAGGCFASFSTLDCIISCG